MKYLKSLTFAVYTKDSAGLDVLIETYAFAFEYPTDAPAKINGQDMDRDNMKKQAVSFIRCLVEFAGTLDELPEDRWLTLKLTYYDDVTPKDYEPQYFTAAKSNVLQFDKNVLRVKIGKIETPAHSLNLKFSGVDNINDSFTVPVDTLSLEDKTATRGDSIGYSKSLIHHQKTGNQGVVEDIQLETLSIQKDEEKAAPVSTKKKDVAAETPVGEEDSDTKMVERVKEYM
jgi:hypothetical protein